MPRAKSNSAFKIWAEEAWAEALGGTAVTRPEIIELYHERGTTYEDQTIEQTITFVKPPQSVTVRSHVKGRVADQLRSPTYLATVRRRLTKKIQGQIIDLASHASEDPGFATWTHGILEQLRIAIQKLSDAEEYAVPEHEGNSCEILRQVRDTLLNDGWMKYREPAVRKITAEILGRLAKADEVTSEDADWAFDQLLDAGLDPAVGPILPNVKEEDKVPG
jgi:hypothetical protein